MTALAVHTLLHYSRGNAATRGGGRLAVFCLESLGASFGGHHMGLSTVAQDWQERRPLVDDGRSRHSPPTGEHSQRRKIPRHRQNATGLDDEETFTTAPDPLPARPCSMSVSERCCAWSHAQQGFSGSVSPRRIFVSFVDAVHCVPVIAMATITTPQTAKICFEDNQTGCASIRSAGCVLHSLDFSGTFAH